MVLESTEAKAPPAPRSRRPMRRIGLKVTVFVAAALVWELAARLANSLFFPPLSEVLVRAQSIWFSGPPRQLFVTEGFLDVVIPSMQRLIPSLIIGILVGIGLGLLIGLIRPFSDTVYPLVHFIRAIPPTVKLPLFIILFGLSDTMNIWLIVFAIAAPLTINVVDGVRSTEPVLLDSARVFRISRGRTVFSLVLPSAAPRIFAGLRLSTMLALIVLVISEMLASSNGLGYFLLYAQRQFHLTDMWAGVLLIGLIGYLLSVLVDIAENSILAWHRAVKAGSR